LQHGRELLPEMSGAPLQGWIQQTLSAEQLGLAVFPAVFLLGFLAAVTSCCSFPVLGAVAGYAGTLGAENRRRDLILVGLAFMIGTVLSLAALGALTGFVGHVAGTSLGVVWRFAGGLLLVLFGLAGLGLVPLRAPKIDLAGRASRRGVTGALVYGLVVGGAATACSVGCNPLLIVIVGATALKGAAVLGAVVFAVFALGYSLPLAAGLVGIGLGLGRLRTTSERVLPIVRAFAGALLIGTGFYLLATIR
jgi:cytochrome c biogenesis protein CcdA